MERHLWGLNPLGYHLDAILLHAANAVLVGLLLSRLNVPGAWLAALIFGVHPVHVESVAWIAERKNVLSGFFYLCALPAYLDFERDRRRSRYVLAFGLFLCAMLSKTIVATFPCVVLLIGWWKRGRIQWRDVAPLIPFFLVGLAAAPLTLHLEKAAGPEWDFTAVERFLRASRAIWFYVVKLAWPHPLIYIYRRWPVEVTAWWYATATLAVLGALWVGRQRFGRGPLTAALYFLMRFAFVADHFQYLASIGLIALIAAALRARVGVALALAGILGALTWQHCRAFENDETIMRDAIAKDPACWMARNNLGIILFDRGDVLEAIEHHRAALRVKPDDAAAENYLALNLFRLDRTEETASHFREARRLRPDHGGYHNNVGITLAQQGDANGAMEQYQEAVRLSPDLSGPHYNLAVALAAAGQPSQAIEQYRISIQCEQSGPEPKRALAWVLATQPDRNLRNGREALHLAGSACRETAFQDVACLDTLAAAYAELGRYTQAEAAAKRAGELASAAGQADLAAAIAHRAVLYRGGTAFRISSNEQYSSFMLSR